MTDWRCPTRRHTLRWIGVTATGSLVALAGCTTGVEEGPTPNVVWAEVDPAIEEITRQQVADVTAMVANHGDMGEIAVTASTRRSGRESPVDSATVTVRLDGADQRAVSFEMTVSPAAEYLEAVAEPAGSG